MNARDEEKAKAAAERRLQDETDRVVEAIGELLYRRSQRKAQPTDLLYLRLHISRDDFATLGQIAAGLATDEEDPARLRAAFALAANRKDILTVCDLAGEIVRLLDGDLVEFKPEEVAP